MKPDVIDDLLPQEKDDEEQTSILVSKEPLPKRGDWYPYCYDELGFAKRVMQFPKRFYNFWVLKPEKEVNYIERFNNGERCFVFNEDLIIKSPWEMKSGLRMPVRDYSWLLEVLQGNEKKASLFNNLVMNFQNKEEDSACTLLDKIIADGDIKLNEIWRVAIDGEPFVLSENDMVVWFSFLKSQFPPELKEESQMPNVYLPNRNGRDENDYKKTMESLGVYRSETGKQGEKIKSEIWLCPKRIKECAESMDISYVNLFVAVYLHELAHAAFDSTITVKQEPGDGDKKYSLEYSGKQYPITEPPAFTMEESLANAMMLQYLDWFVEVEPEYYSLFEDAKRFVNSQILEYQFGIKQFEVGVDCIKWRDYKSKETSSLEKLEKWYDQLFDKDNYTKDMYDEVFK